jgi:ribose/xylose/arabinose/galactoside ABC-type transport system permease subunit/ABC-type branched-subunit amino acid transport system ATPase component
VAASGTGRPGAPRLLPAGGARGVASRLAAYQSGGLLIALILLSLFFGTRSDNFWTSSNLKVVLLQVSVVGIVAIPGAMLVLCGYVDLSVGSVAVLAVAVFGHVSKVDHHSIGVAVIAALAAGLAWGLMNGVLISYLEFSPIVVTLGGYAGARGLAEAITHDQTQFGFGSTFGELGNGTWLGLPVPGVIFIVLFFVGAYVWYVMPSGRHMTAVGAERTAARALGVNVRRIPFFLYVTSGLAAALGGLILTSQLDGASVSIGIGLELQVLTAILLGGVAFSGGRGSLWGVLFGVFFVGVLDNGLVLMNVGPYYANLAVGIVLVLAASADAFYQRLERLPVRVDDTAQRAVAGTPPSAPPVDVAVREREGPPVAADAAVLLEVEHATKRYGPVAALRDVSLRLHAGEVIGLVGDNGAGKSTLVNILSGNVRPDEGRLLVDGVQRDFSDPSEARAAGIETVFQTLALVPTLNIWENVYLRREELGPGPVAKAAHRMNKRAMRREVQRGFERFGVALPPLSTKVSSLSGGQRQQVAITRAVLWGSHVVLLDEPAAALGVRQTELVLALVERLKAHGVGVIFVSHNMQHVLRVADRIAVLFLGQKVADFAVETDTRASDLVALMTGAAAGDMAAARTLP